MASIVKLQAQLHLAQLALTANPTEANRGKVNEILVQLAEAGDLSSTSSTQVIPPVVQEVKKKEVKPKGPPKATTPRATSQAKAPAKPAVTPPVAPQPQQPGE